MKFPELLSAVKQGAVVITVNQRLARTLSAQVEEALLAEGKIAWPSFDIVAYDSWLSESWQRRFELAEIASNEYLLTPEQSLVLWEQVIGDSEESVLLNISATAKAAAKARVLSYQWNINTDISYANGKEDVAAFSRWHDQYKQCLLTNTWIDRASLVNKVQTLFKNEGFFASQQCIFAGFDVFTASQLEIIDTLKQQGVGIEQFVTDNNNKRRHQFCASDAKDELMCMAQWAKEQLSSKPNIKIGIVVPELTAKHSALESTFQAIFYPEVIYPTQLPIAKPYNISLGRSLADYALIKQVFRGLSLFNKELPLAELSALLRSPFVIAGESEWSARASFEAKLRQQGFLSITLKQLVKRLQGYQHCPELLKVSESLLAHQQTKSNRMLASEWAELFRELFDLAGWQGERVISSVEFQILQAWDSVLQDFSRLDRVLSVINLDMAIAQLNKIAKARVFQPETPAAAIQVMGLMEAAGHNFDALWVCGLDALSWPAAASPNAFLPLLEQRKQGLVQASAELQYGLAKSITEKWQTSAATVIFSYPAFIDDTASIASPLIVDIEAVERLSLLSSQPVSPLSQQLGKSELTEQQDDYAPALADSTQSKGGVGIIKDQSACPFKAFAHYRLQARELNEPEPGIDAMLRGSLVHACLELLWDELKTQQALLNLTEQQRVNCVRKVTLMVVEKQSQYEPVLAGRFGQLEAERLQQVLLDWLLVDAAREPFAVSQVEFKQAININKLHINTTIDRIDTLQNGTMAIIDYKTGSARPSAWFSERMEEPQLPLYSVFSEHDIQSIAFAQVKKGDHKYAGITNSEGSFGVLKMIEKEKASTANWDTQLTQWKNSITSLANEYMSGYAAVVPSKKACDYCDLSSLCRVSERV